MARILSIEDDPDLQHLIGAALRPQGYEVHYAFAGPEGYEKVLSLDPDLVICDLMLPGMNGVEIIGAMQANKATKHIPIIVMTAYNDAASMLAASVKALGAVEYVQKPVVMKELISRIKAVLGSRAKKPAGGSELVKGVIRADPKFRTVWIDDRLTATLPPKRFLLLQLLMEEDGPVPREALKAKVWQNGVSDNTLEKTIQRLREDLGPSESRRLQTTSGGYELIG